MSEGVIFKNCVPKIALLNSCRLDEVILTGRTFFHYVYLVSVRNFELSITKKNQNSLIHGF